MLARLTARVALAIGIAGALPACGDAPHAPRGPSILLVVVDTLRADHLSVHGYGRATTPELARRLPSARVFERAYATSPWTLPSMSSLLTGRLPSAHGAGRVTESVGTEFHKLSRRIPTLPELLAASGWATAASVSNPFLDPDFGLARGFEHYDATETTNSELRRADAAVDEALELIAGFGERPYFLMLHLFDPHMDYDPPPATRGAFTGEYASALTLPLDDVEELRALAPRIDEGDAGFVRAAYDEELLAVDRALGRLFEGLEANGALARTLVVLTSDHGEELFEHGGFEHGHALWEELLHVPLLFFGAGVVPGSTGMPVSLTDVFPTLLEAADVAAAPASDGVSLWPAATGGDDPPFRTLFAEGLLYGADAAAALRWPFKLVLTRDGRAWLSELESDPYESRDARAEHPEVVEDLATSLTRRLEDARRANGDAAALDEDLRVQLRSLGYVR